MKQADKTLIAKPAWWDDDWDGEWDASKAQRETERQTFKEWASEREGPGFALIILSCFVADETDHMPRTIALLVAIIVVAYLVRADIKDLRAAGKLKGRALNLAVVLGVLMVLVIGAGLFVIAHFDMNASDAWLSAHTWGLYWLVALIGYGVWDMASFSLTKKS